MYYITTKLCPEPMTVPVNDLLSSIWFFLKILFNQNITKLVSSSISGPCPYTSHKLPFTEFYQFILTSCVLLGYSGKWFFLCFMSHNWALKSPFELLLNESFNFFIFRYRIWFIYLHRVVRIGFILILTRINLPLHFSL